MLDFFFTSDGFKVISLLAVVAAVMFVLGRRQHQLAADPKVVKDQLEQLGTDYTILSDVVVSAELGMNDVSHVVVSAYGVFVLTVKTEAGKVTGREGIENGTLNQQEIFCITLYGKTASMSTLWRK